MKIFGIMLLLLAALMSCSRSNNNKTTINDTVSSDKKNQEITLNKLSGIWSENTNENANFWIKKDSMYFLEDPDNPIKLKIRGDTLISFYDGLTTKDIIYKTTADSLILINELGDTIKLYKIK